MARTAHRAPVLCRDCSHGRNAHGHYRRGTECALCGCAKWKRRRHRWRLVRRARHAAFIMLVSAGVIVIVAGLVIIVGEGLSRR